MNTRAALLLACLAHPGLVFAQADPAEEMQRQLEQRDQLIRDLQRRVEVLEQKLQAQTPATGAAAANAPDSTAGAQAAMPQSSPSPDQPESSGVAEDETARALER